jgi:hypothetical protein
MSPNERIQKAINSCNNALDKLDNNNKRLSIGDLDHAKEYVMAAIHLLIAEIEQEEGEF